MAKAKTIVSRVVAAVIVSMLLFGSMYMAIDSSNSKTPELQVKTIYVEVQNGDAEPFSFMLNTNEIYLKGALTTDDFVKGKEDDTGFVISSVSDISATEGENHWRIYINGEPTAKKADKIEINNNDKFILKLTPDVDDG